jgi:cell division protein FtsN
MVYVDGQAGFELPPADESAPASSAPAKPNINTAPPSSSVSVSSGDSDQYYVIAGSFQDASRANSHLQKIQSAGHGEAQIVRFPNSPYHSVCVDKFNNRREADGLKRQLEKEKIDAFVRAVPKS